jgi:uncharacterized membrane protein
MTRHAHPTNVRLRDRAGLGDRAADRVAGIVGSWPFIIGQGILFTIWVAVNSLAAFGALRFDPYPYFFFNLFMSCEAAFATPIIMISQNRQSEHDRHSAEVDHRRGMEALDLIRLLVEHSNVPTDAATRVHEQWSQRDDEVNGGHDAH